MQGCCSVRTSPRANQRCRIHSSHQWWPWQGSWLAPLLPLDTPSVPGGSCSKFVQSLTAFCVCSNPSLVRRVSRSAEKCVPPWRPSHCPLQTHSLPLVAGNAFIAHLARNTNPHANCHPHNRALQVAGGAAAGVAGAAAAAFAANLVLKRAQKLVRLCGRQRRRSSRCREAVGRGRFDVF